MRYHEERFDEYIRAVEKNDLHPSIGKMFKEYSSTGKDLSNLNIIWAIWCWKVFSGAQAPEAVQSNGFEIL